VEDSCSEEGSQRFSIFSVVLESIEMSSLTSLAGVKSTQSGSKLVSGMDPDESGDDWSSLLVTALAYGRRLAGDIV